MFGTIIAWVLVRYRFPGRRLLDAFVDLPFALPTAVAGIALTALYAPNGWIGQLLAPLGIKVAYTPLGIVIALIFIGLPFVVRTVQPVLEEFDRELEEAAATLGANRRQTVFRVMLPTLMPAILTGFALAFARAVGEYGSVIFIAGNMPFIPEIAPLLIIIRLEEFNYPAAAAIAHGDADDLLRHPAPHQPHPGLAAAEIRPWLMQQSPRSLSAGLRLARPSLPSRYPVRIVLVALAVVFLVLFLLLPLAAVFWEAFRAGLGAYFAAITEPDALAAIKLTLLVAAIAVPANIVFGLAASWAIAKFEFKGKSVLNTLIDLPFSVSPVISGLIYVLLFGAQGCFGP